MLQVDQFSLHTKRLNAPESLAYLLKTQRNDFYRSFSSPISPVPHTLEFESVVSLLAVQKREIAYLTVINWPNEFNEDTRIETLVRAAAMDPYQAKLSSRRNLPGIMCTIDALLRDNILGEMHKAGVLCIAPTQSEIVGYPQPEFAVGIDQFPDAHPPSFVVETNDGNPWTFRTDQVKLAVAGHIKATTTRIKSTRSSYRKLNTFGSAVGNAMRQSDVHVSRGTKVTNLLDLHIQTDAGLKLVRLVGPRTRIGIVGDGDRPSLLENARPAEMIQVLMPDAQIDTEFHDFDPPSIVRRQSQKNSGRSGSLTMESWAFYSPWVGLIKQAMYGW